MLLSGQMDFSFLPGPFLVDGEGRRDASEDEKFPSNLESLVKSTAPKKWKNNPLITLLGKLLGFRV